MRGHATARQPHQTLVVALLALAMLTLGSCGGDEGGGEEGTNQHRNLTVGVIPIADVAPLYLGIDKGFFEAENLTIEPRLAQGGAAILPSVQSGDFQFGFSNNVSLIIASSKGLPMQIVSQGVLGADKASEAWGVLMSAPGSNIREPQDMEGKRIAANTLNNVCEVTINAALEKQGVDVSTLKYREIPFPEMITALERRGVDAACLVEPFVTLARRAGAHEIVPFYVDTAPNLSVATYFTTSEYAQENAEVVDRFVAAMERSLTYAQQNPRDVRRILLEYTEIPRELTREIKLPIWSQDMRRETIELLAQRSQKYGLIEDEPDLDELFPPE